MKLETALIERSESKCELCSSTDHLGIYSVPPDSKGTVDDSIYICETCKEQIEDPEKMVANHWRCLNDSMWSEVTAVQVIAWRMLTRLSAEGWPQELLDMLYLDDDVMTWAKATGEGNSAEGNLKYIDANGAELFEGDTVTIIKDLPVKGGGFTAKRGTAVRNIHLDPENHEHIEGRVNSQQIVILTKYVKKSK